MNILVSSICLKYSERNILEQDLNKQTNERTNEQTNKRTNERTNKQTDERTNKRTKKQTKEQKNKRTNKQTNKQRLYIFRHRWKNIYIFIALQKKNPYFLYRSEIFINSLYVDNHRREVTLNDD